MNAKVSDLMTRQVVVAQPHQTISHVRNVMQRNKIHAIPVVNGEGEPTGIVSTADLLDRKDGAPVSTAMTEKVFGVSEHDGVHVAARVMRNHQIRHVVVTNEQKIVGILSAFDLLRLVEDHRFEMKNAPSPPRKEPRRR